MSRKVEKIAETITKQEAASMLWEARDSLYRAARALQDALPQINEGERGSAERVIKQMDKLQEPMFLWFAILRTNEPAPNAPQQKEGEPS